MHSRDGKTSEFSSAAALWLVFLVFTVLVKVMDVRALGPQGSNIGFAAVNVLFFKLVGTHSFFYGLTQLIGYLSLLICAGFGVYGLMQLIRGKSIKAVDRKILVLGAFYIATILCYFFFEVLVINCRPILVDNLLEASYPSSHTMLTICVALSTAYMAQFFTGKLKPYRKAIINGCYIVMVVAVIGRMLCGYHWLTDIIGGALLATALYSTFLAAQKKFAK